MSASTTTGDGGDPAKRFLGGLLMAVGGLVAGLSGLCTLAVTVVMLLDEGSIQALMSGFAVVAIVGGVPIVFGAGVFFLGRLLYRAGKPKPDPKIFA